MTFLLKFINERVFVQRLSKILDEPVGQILSPNWMLYGHVIKYTKQKFSVKAQSFIYFGSHSVAHSLFLKEAKIISEFQSTGKYFLVGT